jgi:hypothetical protein
VATMMMPIVVILDVVAAVFVLIITAFIVAVA